MSEKTLNKLITSKLPNLEVVFVAACQSEFVGSIFKKCGASHVVCVKQSRHVLDEAAIYFTKCFYLYLFENKKICQAFKEAKADVEFKFKRNESDLFKLFTQENHKCIPFEKR